MTKPPEEIRQFEAPPDAEIMGIGIRGLFDNLADKQIAPILAEYNLSKDVLEDEAWYSLQLYFDLYRVIHKTSSGYMHLVSVGKAIAANVTDADAIGDLETFVTQTLNETATTVIRNTPPGYGYTLDKVDDKHYKITNNTGAPNDLVYGYIWESVRLIADKRSFSFKPLENYPSDTHGATFELTWG